MAKKTMSSMQLEPTGEGPVPISREIGLPRTGEIIDLPTPPLVPRMLAPKAPSNVPDTDALISAFKRRWFSATLLGLLAFIGCGVALFHLLPQKFTARTLLHVASNRPYILTGRADTMIDFTNYQKTQLAIIKSRLVLDAALTDGRMKQLGEPWKDENPAEWLESELKVDYKIAPEVLSIAVSGKDPAVLTTVVSAVRDAYVKQVVNKEYNEKLRLLENLQGLYAGYEKALKERRARFRELAETVGSRDAQLLSRKQQSALERLSLAQKELLELQSDLRRSKVMEATEKQAKWQREETIVNEREIQDVIAADRSVQEHQAEIARQEQALAQMRRVTVLGDADPSVAAYRNARDAAKAALELRRQELRGQIIDQLRQKRIAEKEAMGLHRQKQMESSRELEKILTAEVQKLEQEATFINRGTLDLESVKEDINQAEAVTKRVADQVEALKVELQAPSRVSLLEDAIVSHSEEDKKKMRLVGAGSMGGMFFAVFGVVMVEWKRRRVSHPHDVAQSLGIRVLGELPVAPKIRHYATEKWSLVQHGGYQYDEWVEAVNAARTILLQAARTDSVRCVMVASSTEGEGKSSLCSHLASSLAHKFSRVLLIDGDLRRPTAHRKLNCENEAGLSEVLREERAYEEVIQPTPVKNLFLMSAGQADYQAIQALAQDNLQVLLEVLKQEYDFILIDSSPLLHVADPLMIAQHADAVIFSILRDVSRMPMVYAGYEKIRMLGVRILGSIVHGVKRQAPNYYYRSPTLPNGKAAKNGHTKAGQSK